MNWLEALVLGIIQGLTEFLPVSSSGHLEIGKALFGIKGEENIYFTIVVHGATVLSTIVVLWQEIKKIGLGVLKFQLNAQTNYFLKIILSMIPVGIVGVFFKDEIKTLFSGGHMSFVGAMLIITASLLAFAHFFHSKERKIKYSDAFIIGISQALAVLPGISRSGATISTGLLLGNNKTEIARFSFLMVLLPIIGENILDIISGELTGSGNLHCTPLLIGFIAAFLSGYVACRWMLEIVRKSKLIYFAIYCVIAGLICILFL